MTIHRPFLMGSETEYAVSGERDGQYVDPEDLYPALAEALKRVRAWAHDHGGYQGMYLQHGGRIYLDYGGHPEHATPECHTPREVALYDHAGEVLMALARDGACAADPGLRVRVLKNNLDPCDPEENTYGTHESYTGWVFPDRMGPMLIPHLVSRVLYCGAGALSRNEMGLGFELSQRARHLDQIEGDDTTGNRAIFSTRLRKEADGGMDWLRVHLIGKDAQRSPFGTYLTYGVTGLLVQMANRGFTFGAGLTLADPVAAVRQASLDPLGKVLLRLEDGRRMTAVQIQASYLEECERALPTGNLPEWAGEVLGHWREVLTDLERDPRRLANRLDAYCKFVIIEHELQRKGLEWADLRQGVAIASDLRSGYSSQVITAILSDSDAGLEDHGLQAFAAARERFKVDQPGEAERMLFATRLQALDLKYHELGGLYDRLFEGGHFRNFLTREELENASRLPPSGGRAAVRGAWIARQGGENVRADWAFVWQPGTGTAVDLRDPFSGQERSVQVKLTEGLDPWCADVPELLADAAV